MLVKVLKSKLVLGTRSYKAGDVFECRDAEAALLLASRLVERASGKATVSSPKAPSVNLGPRQQQAAEPSRVAAVEEEKEPVPSVGALSGAARPTAALSKPRGASATARKTTKESDSAE